MVEDALKSELDSLDEDQLDERRQTHNIEKSTDIELTKSNTLKSQMNEI